MQILLKVWLETQQLLFVTVLSYTSGPVVAQHHIELLSGVACQQLQLEDVDLLAVVRGYGIAAHERKRLEAIVHVVSEVEDSGEAGYTNLSIALPHED